MIIIGSIILVGIIILLILDEPQTPEDEYEVHKYFQGSHKDV